MPRLASLLALLPIAAFALAGCGGDDKSSGGGGSETPAATATTEEATTTPEEDGGGATVPENLPENLDEAIAQCESAVDANTQLSDASKDRLKQLCGEAANGDPERLQEIAREACEAVVEESLPEGEARDTALKSCEGAGAGVAP